MLILMPNRRTSLHFSLFDSILSSVKASSCTLQPGQAGLAFLSHWFISYSAPVELSGPSRAELWLYWAAPRWASVEFPFREIKAEIKEEKHIPTLP